MFILIYYYKNQILKHKNHLIFFATLGVSLLIGTKRIYFFLALLFLFHLYRVRKRFNLKSLLLVITTIAIGFIFKSKLTDLFMSKFGIFVQVYHKKGLLASILSYRDTTLTKTINDVVLPHWDFFNVFVGGIDYNIIRPEMDIFDLFFFFGLLGLMLYFLFSKTVYKTLNFRNRFIKITLIIILLIAFISSGFFNSTNIPFIFFIALYYLNELTIENKKSSLNTSH